MDPGQVGTFMDITGAGEVEARHTLEAFEGDLNAAVNHYLEHGTSAPRQLQAPTLDRDTDFGRPRNDIPQNAYAGPAVLSDPPPSLPWRSEEDGSGDGPIGVMRGRTEPLIDEQMGTQRAGGLMPRVSHPPDVQDVPITWDDDDEPLEHKNSEGRLSSIAPRVEELPPDAEVGVPGNSSRAFYEEREDDEELPSGIAPVRPVPFANSVGPFREADAGGMDLDRIPGSDFGDYTMGSGLAVGDDDEMLRAAIEKSKEEAQEARRVNNPFPAGSEVRVGDEEDDDVARAMALSIETAKEERARREGGSQDNLVGGSDDMDGDFDHGKENIPQFGSGLPGNDEDASARAPPATPLNLEEEEDAVEEVEPLVRRRILGRRGGPSGRSVWPMPQQLDEAQRQSQIRTERVGGQATNNHWGTMEGTGLRDYSPEDELAGVSAEEQEEAKMIEAAMFGIPYVPRNGTVQNASASANYQMPPGLGGHLGPMRDQFPTASRELGLGVYEDEEDEEGGGFVRRRAPEPPSEAMIEQRLLREQQDDEYMASLTADREKEERAEMEKEVAKREAQAEEDRKREEALSAQREAEELERKLKAKQESLPSEPPSDDSGAITLQVRMPDGSRRSRRFNKFDPLQALFDFVDVSGGVTPGSYRLVRTYPRRAFSEKSGEETRSFEDLGLSSSRQETLLLENI